MTLFGAEGKVAPVATVPPPPSPPEGVRSGGRRMSGTTGAAPLDAPPDAPRHVSRLVPGGPRVVAPGAAGPTSVDATSDVTPATVVQRVDGDPLALGRLLAAVEPLRAEADAVIVTDADVETVRFLAVLAVLEGRAPMPDYDLADPSLKWHAPAGVKAVPNPPSIVTPDAPDAAGRPA